MSINFTYALILTGIQIVFTLVLYFLGFETEKIAQLQHLSWIGLIYTTVVLWFGLRATREAAPDKSLSYGRGVGTGVLISLYAGLLGGVYRYLHLKFVNPSFVDYQMDLIRQQWAARGMSSAQMDQAEPITRMMMGPVLQAVMSPIFAVIFGVIISLLLAIFLKRAPAVPDTSPQV